MTLASLNRWQAAPIHLAISAVIASAVFGLMVFLWYPKPFFAAAGGTMLLVLLIGVDVVLGPLLTLLVYNPQKKSLKFDLMAIAALQITALVYGGWIMFNARPVYVAYAGDRFELVEAQAIEPGDHARAPPAFRDMPLNGPVIVGTKFPTNEAEQDMLRRAVMVGGSIGVFPQHYVPYSAVASSVPTKAATLSALRRKHPEAAGAIDDIIAASGKAEHTLRYVPLQARHGDMAVVVDGKNGAVVGVIPVDPW
jgi:hypothetical protein